MQHQNTQHVEPVYTHAVASAYTNTCNNTCIEIKPTYNISNSTKPYRTSMREPEYKQWPARLRVKSTW